MNLRELINSLINGAHGEKVRFLLAGGLNTVVGYGLFALGLWLLTPVFAPLAQLPPAECGSSMRDFLWIDDMTPHLVWIGEHSYLLIQWIMWALCVPLAALTLKHFAFRAEGAYVPQALKAYMVYLPAQLITSGLLAFFTLVLGFHPLLGQLFAIVIAVIVSYLGHKYFTFRTSTSL